ncbi:MAG: hypothetical protein QN732_11785 [Nitrososphaeraceae archaeon]|nr:hypothetical protein [Nitrososphaeraceae archaeon]
MNSLFEQHKQLQIKSTDALSRHIGSDLDSICKNCKARKFGHITGRELSSGNTTKNS